MTNFFPQQLLLLLLLLSSQQLLPFNSIKQRTKRPKKEPLKSALAQKTHKHPKTNDRKSFDAGLVMAAEEKIVVCVIAVVINRNLVGLGS
jgi:hypothetical protein